MEGQALLRANSKQQELLIQLSQQLPELDKVDIEQCPTVYEDGSYSIEFYCEDLISELVQRIELYSNGRNLGYLDYGVGAEPVRGLVCFTSAPEYFVGGKLHSNSYKKYYSQPFLLQCDLVVLTFVIHMHDGTVYELSTGGLLCVSKNTKDVENIGHMINKLTEFDQSALGGGLFAQQLSPLQSLHETWTHNIFSSLESYTKLLGEVIQCYRTNYPYFRTMGKHTIKKEQALQSPFKVKAVTLNSFQWLMQNSEQMTEINSSKGVRYRGKHYVPLQINAENNIKSSDVYENQVVVSFINLVLHESRQIYTRYNEAVENERSNLQKGASQVAERAAALASPAVTGVNSTGAGAELNVTNQSTGVVNTSAASSGTISTSTANAEASSTGSAGDTKPTAVVTEAASSIPAGATTELEAAAQNSSAVPTQPAGESGTSAVDTDVVGHGGADTSVSDTRDSDTRVLDTETNEDGATANKTQLSSSQTIQGAVAAGYQTPILAVRTFQVAYCKGLLDNLKQAIDQLSALLHQYLMLFEIKVSPLLGMPRKTKTFQEIKPYSQVFVMLLKWFQHGEVEIKHERLTLQAKTLDKVFEYYCLVELLTLFTRKGYSPALGENSAYHFPYMVNNRVLKGGNNDLANTYVLRKQDVTMTLYYQPLISSTEFQNELSLYRTTNPHHQTDYYEPDFVLKFSKDGEESYAIFDAKFSSRRNIFDHYFSEVTRKYSLEIAVNQPYPVPRLVWIFQGRMMTSKEEALWRHHNSPLALQLKQHTSFGVIALNALTEGITEELWTEMQSSIPWI